MDSITSHPKRRGKEDIIDMRVLEQAYGSDYPSKITPSKITLSQVEINTFADPTMILKTMAPSLDIEKRLMRLKDEHLAD